MTKAKKRLIVLAGVIAIILGFYVYNIYMNLVAIPLRFAADGVLYIEVTNKGLLRYYNGSARSINGKMFDIRNCLYMSTIIDEYFEIQLSEEDFKEMIEICESAKGGPLASKDDRWRLSYKGVVYLPYLSTIASEDEGILRPVPLKMLEIVKEHRKLTGK